MKVDAETLDGIEEAIAMHSNEKFNDDTMAAIHEDIRRRFPDATYVDVGKVGAREMVVTVRRPPTIELSLVFNV